MPGLLYVDGLVLFGELEEDLKVMGGCVVETCRKRGLKVNADKSKMIMLGGEERFKCEVFAEQTQLELVSEFHFLGCDLDESDTDGVGC